jgi:predicted metal-dependent hydrolase
MPKQIETLKLPDGENIPVTIQRDKRLKKTARWQREKDGGLLLRIPQRYPKSSLPGLLESISTQLLKQRQRTRRRSDDDLQSRADLINRKYFNSKIRWQAIRWVRPMKTRLGSCTSGGPTDGHIRISEEIRDWPQWVVDYVIAHELTHRIHPNHSREFWQTLQQAYPESERARGFIKGVMFAQGRPWDEED